MSRVRAAHFFRSSAAYACAVEIFFVFGKNNFIFGRFFSGKFLFFIFIGVHFSPKCVTMERTGFRKNGTSIPIFLAITRSCFRESGEPNRLLRPRSVVAALLEPPPSPEARGMRLCR